MPTRLETLLRHRAEHAEDHESRRVWLFHAHTYFDHTSVERTEEARAFRDSIATAFEGNAHVEVHSFVAQPVGPHPRGSFEVLFTRDAFVELVPWLMFSRPEGMDVLIHPLTKSQSLDHSQRALWLGRPVEVDRAMLAAVDARLEAAGRTEVEIIEGTKRH
jgi:DOPA 4,5-dioxygenase